MFTKGTMTKSLVLLALMTPVLMPNGGCSGSGSSCGSFSGTFIGVRFIDIDWNFRWTSEQPSLPIGTIVAGTANGVPLFLAPNGDVYIQRPGQSGYNKVEHPYPKEIKEAIKAYQAGQAGGDGDAMVLANAALGAITVPDSDLTVPDPDTSGVSINDGDLRKDDSLNCVFVMPADCLSRGGAGPMVDEGEEPSVSMMVDFDFDIDDNWAHVEFTTALPGPDAEAAIRDLNGKFGIVLAVSVCEEEETITLEIDGTINGVLRLLYVLGFETLDANSAWPGDVEIVFNQDWCAIFVSVDGELQRVVLMQPGDG